MRSNKNMLLVTAAISMIDKGLAPVRHHLAGLGMQEHAGGGATVSRSPFSVGMSSNDFTTWMAPTAEAWPLGLVAWHSYEPASASVSGET